MNGNKEEKASIKVRDSNNMFGGVTS